MELIITIKKVTETKEQAEIIAREIKANVPIDEAKGEIITATISEKI